MEVPRFWRTNAQRYRLEGEECVDCGKVSFPPSGVCYHCSDRNHNLNGSEVKSYSHEILGEAETNPNPTTQTVEGMVNQEEIIIYQASTPTLV